MNEIFRTYAYCDNKIQICIKYHRLSYDHFTERKDSIINNTKKGRVPAAIETCVYVT